MEDVDRIRELATLIRSTIEKMSIDEFPNSSFFMNFPRGCCGDASNLLAKYLSENGIKVEYVWGMKENQSHAWLEYGNFIIDITADQFPEIKIKVFVSEDRTWHSVFNVQSRSDGDFDKFESYNRMRLRTIYNNIIQRIERGYAVEDKDCACLYLDEFKEFGSYGHYESINSVIENLHKEGLLDEITPQQLSQGLSISEYRCSKCGQIWRMCKPDFPVKGFLRQVNMLGF